MKVTVVSWLLFSALLVNLPITFESLKITCLCPRVNFVTMVDVKGNRAINSFIELRLCKSKYTSIVWCKHTILRTSTIEKLTWLFNSTLIKRLTNLKRCCPVAALHLLIFVELAHHAVGVDNLVTKVPANVKLLITSRIYKWRNGSFCNKSCQS